MAFARHANREIALHLLALCHTYHREKKTTDRPTRKELHFYLAIICNIEVLGSRVKKQWRLGRKSGVPYLPSSVIIIRTLYVCIVVAEICARDKNMIVMQRRCKAVEPMEHGFRWSAKHYWCAQYPHKYPRKVAVTLVSRAPNFQLSIEPLLYVANVIYFGQAFIFLIVS